jgi:hypothetical protein
MCPHTPRPLEATLKHRSLIPVTLLALLAIGCETAELGPKPVWAGGDAPTLADTSLPDISTGDSAVEPDSTDASSDGETTADVSADVTVTPETSSDGAITVDADATEDGAPTVDADATEDAAPTVDADATEDTAPVEDVAADTAAADVSTDLPSEDLAQADASDCDPASDPTCAGALAPTWQLENVAQATVGFGETYGLEAYAGTVTVLALLTGG